MSVGVPTDQKQKKKNQFRGKLF